MNRRVENRIILSVWLLVLAAVVLIVIQFRSVHVASVERVREDSGAVVFVVGVNNPTANKVIAEVTLITGVIATDAGPPPTRSRRSWNVHVPAGETVKTQTRLEGQIEKYRTNVPFSVNISAVEVVKN